MNHQDHVNLIRAAVDGPGGTWADFGSGEGAFTLALREVAGPEAEIFSVDKDRRRLDQQERNFRAMFRAKDEPTRLHLMPADFIEPLALPPLDGMLMANSLHFFRDKERVLRRLGTFLKPRGRLILVEYNVDTGNPWVPFPISFSTFRGIAGRAGFQEPRLVATAPSRFLREMYAALALRQA